MNPRTIFLRLILALVFCLLISSGHAADVTWGTPQKISGNTDVSTTGNLIGAFNVGDVGVPSTTVNGVLFQSFAAPGGNGSSGTATMTAGGGGVFASNTAGGSGSGNFAALSPAYQTLLMSRICPLFDPVTLTLSGLIVGAQYQFQFWSNESSDSNSYSLTATGGANSVNLHSNDDHANGGLGEWVIGGFTADAATQSIRFIGDGDGGFLNGFQLRQLPATNAVPESGSTLLLLVLALAALLLTKGKLPRLTSAD